MGGSTGPWNILLKQATFYKIEEVNSANTFNSYIPEYPN
jgi:hypothetical protein